MDKRNQGLDLLRAMAILLILILHARDFIYDIPPRLDQIIGHGWIGVDLFFVLSGYLIGNQLFNTEFKSYSENLKEFWIKRWTRTLPLYFIVLFTYVIIKPLLGFPFQGSPYPFLVFIQNYYNPQDFVQSWSLCIEEQFYIILPIIFYFLLNQKSRPWFWGILIAIGIIGRFLIVRENQYFFSSRNLLAFAIEFKTHYHLDGLAFGVLLASTKNSWFDFSKRFKNLILISASTTLIFIISFTSSDPQGLWAIWIYFILALLFSLILMASIHTEFPSPIQFITEKIAIYSYGLYLWNNLVQRFMVKINWQVHGLLLFIIFIFISFFLSFATYHLIEIPGLKLRNKILKRTTRA